MYLPQEIHKDKSLLSFGLELISEFYIKRIFFEAQKMYMHALCIYDS